MTELSTHAKEESTFIITAAFKDEDGDAVAPDTAIWTLSEKDGTVINSREDVAINSPTSSEDIVLKGDDLARQGADDDGKRILTVKATYTSTRVTGGPLNETAVFWIDDLVVVT